MHATCIMKEIINIYHIIYNSAYYFFPLDMSMDIMDSDIVVQQVSP